MGQRCQAWVYADGNGKGSKQTLMMQEKRMLMVILMYIWRRKMGPSEHMAGTEKAESVGHYGEVPRLAGRRMRNFFSSCLCFSQ